MYPRALQSEFMYLNLAIDSILLDQNIDTLYHFIVVK